MYYDGTRYYKNPNGIIYRITLSGIYLASGDKDIKDTLIDFK